VRFDPATHTVHAAGRTWQADPAHTFHEDLRSPAVSGYMHRGRGCLVRFESGWAASIIWGAGTYSSNHDCWHDDDPFTEEPTTVEVGVIDRTGELRMRHKSEDGLEWHEVESYLTDEELAALLDQLASLPTEYDYGERPPSVEEVTRMARDYAEQYGTQQDRDLLDGLGQ
jgi:hypothetical protein